MGLSSPYINHRHPATGELLSPAPVQVACRACLHQCAPLQRLRTPTARACLVVAATSHSSGLTQGLSPHVHAGKCARSLRACISATHLAAHCPAPPL